MTIELGVDTFGDVTFDDDGRPKSQAQVLRDVVEQGVLADQVGLGSFIDSFPLFGYDLDQYEQLFEEKLDLFAALLPQEPVTWSGKLRPPLADQRVFPRVEPGPLRTWIGVGGN